MCFLKRVRLWGTFSCFQTKFVNTNQEHVALEPFFRENFLNNLYDNLELPNSVKNIVSLPPAAFITVPTSFSTGGAPLNANGVTFSKNVWSTRLSGWLQPGLQKVNLGWEVPVTRVSSANYILLLAPYRNYPSYTFFPNSEAGWIWTKNCTLPGPLRHQYLIACCISSIWNGFQYWPLKGDTVLCTIFVIWKTEICRAYSQLSSQVYIYSVKGVHLRSSQV